MSEDAARPIIVVKRKKGGAGHHGGAWKVAYADFVTAMMAFFMVMWLVASVSKEQRAAMFEYFHNPSMEAGHSVKAAPGQAGPGGASTSLIKLGGGLDAPKKPSSDSHAPPGPKDEVAKYREMAEAKEKGQLETLLQELRQAIALGKVLEPFKDQLLLDITPEGLRIQIVDKQNRPMFDNGSSALKDYTTKILVELAQYLNAVPNRISLSGHTDARPYAGTAKSYSNWDLSADRANAARRALIAGGLDEKKIARVVGLASSVLFVKDEPYSHVNRRISIIVMTHRAEDAALSIEAPASATAAKDGAATGAAAVAAPAATTVGAEPAATPADKATEHANPEATPAGVPTASAK